MSNAFLKRLRFGPELQLILVFILLSTGLYMGATYFGQGISDNGNAIQVAGRMRLDMNRLYRFIAEAENADPERVVAAIVQMHELSQQIDVQFDALQRGGSVTIAPGATLTVPVGRMPADAAAVLPQIEALWRPLQQATARLAESDQARQEQLLTALLQYARANEAAISGQASRLLGLLSFDSFDKASRLQQVQLVGAVLGVAFFFFLIFLYSRQLKQVRAAKRETDEILHTVSSGLFLLDRSYRLGNQYSERLEHILQRKELGGKSFLELLEVMVPQETLRMVTDYLDLLFSDRVNESLISSLNPLDRVRVNLPTDSGRIEKRYLEFSFRRVFDDDTLLHLLVSVNDVTDKVTLGEELETAKAENDQQTERLLEMVVGLFRLEPELLRNTLSRWSDALMKANDALREAGAEQTKLRPLIDEVFRPVHTVKGEAAGLGLGFLAQRAAAVEKELAELRMRDQLGGNDFLPATVRLEELFAQFSTVSSVVMKLHDLSTASASQPEPVRSAEPAANGGEDLAALLVELSHQLQTETERPAELTCSGLAADAVPPGLQNTLREILVQLLRNAYAHGLEAPSERLASGKSESGHIRVQLKPLDSEQGYELLFQDDGRGIDFERIRSRAVQLGKVEASQAGALDQRQLLALMFQPGFSTAAEVDDQAGYGVGMDIIMQAVRRAGGRINIATKSGQNTVFRVRLPVPA